MRNYGSCVVCGEDVIGHRSKSRSVGVLRHVRCRSMRDMAANPSAPPPEAAEPAHGRPSAFAPVCWAIPPPSPRLAAGVLQHVHCRPMRDMAANPSVPPASPEPAAHGRPGAFAPGRWAIPPPSPRLAAAARIAIADESVPSRRDAASDFASSKQTQRPPDPASAPAGVLDIFAFGLCDDTGEFAPCVVCASKITFTRRFTLECGHTFCHECILPWVRARGTCPTCRKDVGAAPRDAPTRAGAAVEPVTGIKCAYVSATELDVSAPGFETVREVSVHMLLDVVNLFRAADGKPSVA